MKYTHPQTVSVELCIKKKREAIYFIKVRYGHEIVWLFPRNMLLDNDNCTYHKKELAIKVGAVV